MDKVEKIDYIKNHINLLQDFICPDYPDLEIFSHQYSLQIPFNIYSNLPEGTKYCYTYLDFDKLSVINEQHGKEIGDIALHNALKIIKSCLPKNALMGRIGGDEFYIITPGMEKENADLMCSKISSSLDYYSSKVYGLTATLSPECSLKTKADVFHTRNFEALQKITEKRVSMRKSKNKKDAAVLANIYSDSLIDLPIPDGISEVQQENWKTLNANISAATKNHLRDIRPSKEFRYDNQHIQAEAMSIITAIGELIEDNLKEKKVKDTKSEFDIPSKDAELIHSLFTKPTTDLTNLSDEELDDLKSSVSAFSESLVRDCNSGLLSKSYYNLYLASELEKSKSDYQLVYFSISGIRPSNSAYGHDFTDYRIQETAKRLINAFNEKRMFNNSSFSFDEKDIFLTDQGGGNYMAIIPKEQSLSEEEINSIVEDVNLTADVEKPKSTFLIASAFQNDVNSSNIPMILDEHENRSNKKPFVKLARHLKGKCNIAKDSLKEIILSSTDNKVAFRKSIATATRFYMQNIDNADDINTKKFFLTNVFSSLVNHESLHNKELDDELDK